MLRVGGTIWGSVAIIIYGQNDTVKGMYMASIYAIYELLINTGVTWSLYPTRWMTAVDEIEYKKYEQKAFSVRRKFRKGVSSSSDDDEP